MKKPLYLTLKREWFDMILEGIKTEEYREIKPYWTKRLIDKQYSSIIFRNGYRTDAPAFEIELLSITMGFGYIAWGANPWQDYYILKLGKIIK